MGLAEGFDAWLITVGNEILIGKTVNSNFAWLGRKLTLLGYRVKGGIIVPDILEDISWAFKTALARGARVIISTGGLGPTFDDKTVEGLALALNVELQINERALKMVEEKYSKRGLPLTEARIKMAKLPKGATPLPNPVGTAPGVHVVVMGCDIFLLPGVPREMEAIFEAYVEPILREKGPKVYFAEARVKSYGVPESEIAPLIWKAMKDTDNVYIKSHPQGAELGVPILEFHITASSRSPEEARKSVEKAREKLIEYLKTKGARIEE